MLDISNSLVARHTKLTGACAQATVSLYAQATTTYAKANLDS
jgi:hypothetical protein